MRFHSVRYFHILKEKGSTGFFYIKEFLFLPKKLEVMIILKALFWISRILLLFPFTILIFWVIEMGLYYIITWLAGMSKISFVLFIILVGGTSFWGLMMLISALCVLAARISPVKYLGEGFVALNALMFGFMTIRETWTTYTEINSGVLLPVFLTIFIIIVLTSMFIGISSAFEKSRNKV